MFRRRVLKQQQQRQQGPQGKQQQRQWQVGAFGPLLMCLGLPSRLGLWVVLLWECVLLLLCVLSCLLLVA